MDDHLFECQAALAKTAVAETNVQRAKVRYLENQLMLQLPTIWAQQERIVLLESIIAIGQSQQGSKP